MAIVIPSKEEVIALREKYPAGTRVRLNAPLITSDFTRIEAGTVGVIDSVEKCGAVSIVLDTHIHLCYYPQYDKDKILRRV
jgi:hypothetical protein